MAPRVVFLAALLVVSVLAASVVADNTSTLHADYLASSAEEAVRIAQAQLGGFSSSVSNFGALNAPQGATITSTNGDFSISAANTQVLGSIVGISSSGTFQVAANKAVQIQGATTTFSGPSGVSFSANGGLDVNINNELKVQTTGDQSFVADSINFNSGEGAVIVKSQSTFAAQANTINVAGDNGLFLVGNTVAVSAGDTFDAESQNVKITANSGLLLQANSNDIQIHANDQFLVTSSLFSASAVSGIIAQAAQGEVSVTAGNTLTGTAGNSFTVTAEKLVSVSAKGRLGLTSYQNVVLQATEGLSYTVTTNKFNLNSTTLNINTDVFNVDLTSSLLVSSKDQTITLTSTEKNIIGGQVVTFKATQSLLSVSSAFDLKFSATINPSDVISIGAGSAAPISFSAATASFSTNQATWNGNSLIFAGTAMTFSANDEPQQSVSITSSSSANFNAASLSVQGGSGAISSSSTITWTTPALTVQTTAQGASLPSISISDTTTTFTTPSFSFSASEVDFSPATFTLTSTTTQLTSTRDIVGVISAGTTISAPTFKMQATSGDLLLGGYGGTTFTSNPTNSLSISSPSGLLNLNSQAQLQITTTGAGLTATANTLHWNSTNGVSFTSQGPTTIGAAGANFYWNGFSTVTGSTGVSVLPSGTFSWSSGVDQDLTFSAGSTTVSAATFLRVAGPEIRLDSGSNVFTLTATTGTQSITSSTGSSISFVTTGSNNFVASGATSVTAASGDRTAITSAAQSSLVAAGFVSLAAPSSLAHLHSTGGTFSVSYTGNFLGTSTQLAQMVSGTTFSVTAGTFADYTGNTVTIEGGALLFQQQSATDAVVVSSTQQIQLNAPNGAALFQSTSGGISASGTNTLSFTTPAQMTIVAGGKASYTAGTNMLISGSTSVQQTASTTVSSVSTGASTFTGGAISFQGAGVTATSATFSATTAEALPLLVRSTGGALSLTGAQVGISSNDDVILTGGMPVTWTATTGVVSIQASGANAGVQMISGGDSLYTAMQSVSLTVQDRAFGARDITITSGGDTVMTLSGTTPPTTAFSITSTGSTFDNSLGADVGIVLRSNTNNDVVVQSGDAVLMIASQGAAFEVKEGSATVNAKTALTWTATSNDLLIESSTGTVGINTGISGAANGNTLIASTGTAPSGAPLVAESTGTMTLNGASLNLISNSGVRGVEILADDGHITLTSATAFTNTATGSIYIESGDAASLISSAKLAITSTAGNVQFEAQSSITGTSKLNAAGDSILFSAGFVSVSSSLNNDLALLVDNTNLVSGSTAGATVVQSGFDYTFASGNGGSTFVSSNGVMSIGSAGSISVSASASAGTGVTVTSTSDQFWSGRNEIVFDPTTLAQIGTMANRAVIHITAGGDSLSNAVEIETVSTAAWNSATSIELSAAQRFVHTNQAGGVSVTSVGGFSLTSFGTPGAESDVIIQAGQQVSLVSADSLAVGPSGAVSVTSSGAGGIAFTANNNVLLSTPRNAQLYAQRSTSVSGNSWALHAGNTLTWASDDHQVYSATGLLSFQSTTSTTFESNNGISMTLAAPNTGATDIVFTTLQRDSGITFNARSSSSNLVASSAAALVSMLSKSDASVIGNGGVSISAATYTASAGEDYVLSSSDYVSVLSQGPITITSNKPQPGSDIIVSSSSFVRTSSPNAATTWTAGLNAVSGVTQGTNQISISADDNIIIDTVPLLGGSITVGDNAKTVELHIETGRNSVVRSGLDWNVATIASQLQVSTDGGPTEDGFGMRWTSTGPPSSYIKLKSSNNAVVLQGVNGVQVDAGYIVSASAGATSILAEGPTGVHIESTDAGAYISWISATSDHTIVAHNGSVSFAAPGTQPQTGWIHAFGPGTGKFESSLGPVSINSAVSSILFGTQSFVVQATSGPVRFTANGADLDTADVGINFAAGRNLLARSVGDINVRGLSVTVGSIQDTLGSVVINAGAEIEVAAEGDNANGNAIEIISQDSTASLDFLCGSEFIIEANGNAQVIGDRGIDLFANDEVTIVSFTNVTFTGSAQPSTRPLYPYAYPNTGVYVGTVASAAGGESVQFYSGSDSIIEAAEDIVATARTSLTFDSGGELLFSAGGPVSITANGPGTFTTAADTVISSTRDVSISAASLAISGAQATFTANGQVQQPGSGDLRFTATGSAAQSLTMNANNIFLGTGEPVVVAPGSRLVIPVVGGNIACGAANNRAFYFNSGSLSLCFCANGSLVCKALA